MDVLTLFLGIVAIILIYYIFESSTRRPKNYPPGPKGLPIVGNLFALGGLSHIRTMKMMETYGNTMGFKIGSYRSVVFHDADDIREVFGKLEFAGRYGYNVLMDSNYGEWNVGVLVSEGKVWEDTRRFSLRGLRDHGFGKRSMESIIQEECQELIQDLKGKVGQPISTQICFNAAVLNVIWSIISGSRFALDDPKLAELLTLLMVFVRNSFSGFRLLNFMFPLAVDLRKKFPFLFPKTNDLFREKLFSMLRETIQEHRETIQIGNPRDFIDTFLEETMKTNDPNSTFKSNDDDLHLIALLMDFFIAGSETTSTTLTWSLYFLSMNPDKQEKLSQEILSVVGNRQVTLEDRPKLPYTEATLTEILRMSSLVPNSVPHSTIKDVTFKGFHIPKHTLIFGNIYAVHFNSKTFPDPYSFKPERFLSPDEKTFNRHPHIMPFSVGKRQCLGEALARDEFFVFLTNIVQQFKISFPVNEPHDNIQGLEGLVLSPEPHSIVLVDRNSQ